MQQPRLESLKNAQEICILFVWLEDNAEFFVQGVNPHLAVLHINYST